MIDLLVQLEIVNAERAREVTMLAGFIVAATVIPVATFAILNTQGWFRKAMDFFRTNPLSAAFLTILAAQMFVYGATKLVTTSREQCDYRLGSAKDVTDDWLQYVRMTGTEMPTNINVGCCGNACTNELTFTRTGQFYIETQMLTNGEDFVTSSFWVRDNETNDWIKATADTYLHEGTPGIVQWISGWKGEIAHLPEYQDPKDYRFWFIGPQAKLPDKVIEGGKEIEIDRYFRDAHHVRIEFHPIQSELEGRTFVLQVRTVSNSDGIELLGDWQTLQSTTSRVFDVQGNFVQTYNRLRIYCDKEVE